MDWWLGLLWCVQCVQRGIAPLLRHLQSLQVRYTQAAAVRYDDAQNLPTHAAGWPKPGLEV